VQNLSKEFRGEKVLYHGDKRSKGVITMSLINVTEKIVLKIM